MVRLLTVELQKIAIEELHEDPEMVENDIKNIQEWIKQQPHLIAPTDKQWILGFLRGCKFSYEKTKAKLDMFYTAKSLIPEMTRPKNIFSSEMQTLLNAGVILPLPYSKNYKGPRVILIHFKKNVDTNIINAGSACGLLYMILNILMVEDDNFMISGHIFWVDMKNYPLKILFQLTPNFLKNFFYCILTSLPVRMKTYILTGYPTIAEKVVNIIKLCLTPKLRERFFVYTENDFEKMFEYVPKTHMPKEFGGENSNTEDITAYWKNKVESYSSWFDENDQYCTNEALRPQKAISFTNIIGIDGSFRKLNID